MSFDVVAYATTAQRLRWHDLDPYRFRTHRLSDGALRCLRCMSDIETHTVCYLRDRLVTPVTLRPRSHHLPPCGTTRSTGTVKYSTSPPAPNTPARRTIGSAGRTLRRSSTVIRNRFIRRASELQRAGRTQIVDPGYRLSAWLGLASRLSAP